MNLAVALLLVAGVADRDLRGDLTFIAGVNPLDRHDPANAGAADFTFRQVSELHLVLSGAIRLYQLYVSPQGPPGCNFTVSCSHFMTQAVQKYGLLHGLFMASDRLMRCNPASRRHYALDPFSHRAIDHPVGAYYLFAPRGGRTRTW